MDETHKKKDGSVPLAFLFPLHRDFQHAYPSCVNKSTARRNISPKSSKPETAAALISSTLCSGQIMTVLECCCLFAAASMESISGYWMLTISECCCSFAASTGAALKFPTRPSCALFFLLCPMMASTTITAVDTVATMARSRFLLYRGDVVVGGGDGGGSHPSPMACPRSGVNGKYCFIFLLLGGWFRLLSQMNGLIKWWTESNA